MAEIGEKFDNIKKLIENQGPDIGQIEKKVNKAASRRVRKALSQIARECKELRAIIQDKVKGGK